MWISRAPKSLDWAMKPLKHESIRSRLCLAGSPDTAWRTSFISSAGTGGLAKNGRSGVGQGPVIVEFGMRR